MPVSQMGYKLLVRQLVTNELLSSEDRAVVKEIVFALDLQGDVSLSDVNLKWIDQQRIEASMVYLLNTYERLMAKTEAELEEIEATARLDMPKGAAGNEQERKAYVRLDPNVAVHKDRVLNAKSLYQDLDRLAKTVFRRDKKLDSLTVNYRRELQADEQ
jgi:hypothetical protein